MRNPTDPRIQRDNTIHDPYGNYSLSGGTIAISDVDRVIRHNNNIFAVLRTDNGAIIANVAQPNPYNLHNAYGIRWVLTPNDRDYSAVCRLAGVSQ